MNSARRVTTQDIAEAAGVTSGTVSRALRGDPVVSRATRERIQEIARRLNYQPNLSARALRTGRSGTLALACSTGPWVLHHPYFSRLGSGFMTAAAEEGQRVTVYTPPAATAFPVSVEDQEWPREMSNGLVDGCAVYQSHRLSQESLRFLLDSRLYVVLLNTDVDVPGFFQLRSGSDERIRESLRWAAELGARSAAVLGLPERMTTVNQGLRAGMEAPPRGLDVRFEEIRHYEPDEPKAVVEALDRIHAARPGALVLNSDAHLALLRAGRREGRWSREPAVFHHRPADAEANVLDREVHYLVADLLEGGRKAYGMIRRAQKGEPASSESLQWKRAEG